MNAEERELSIACARLERAVTEMLSLFEDEIGESGELHRLIRESLRRANATNN
jgi:hypothetical protein